MPITNSWLKANNGRLRDRVEEKADGEGLSVRATKTGKLVFQLRYRWEGKPARVDLGVYPSTGLKDARDLRDKTKALLFNGIDPRVHRAAEKATRKKEWTLEEAYREWHKSQREGSVKGAAQSLRSFELYVFPALGARPITTVPVGAWVELLETMVDQVPSIASRVLNNAKQMYRWLERREVVDLPRMQNLHARKDFGIEKGTRGRSLPDDELVIFFKALKTCRMYISNKIYVQLCLMLGCRNGELRTLSPDDIDWDAGIWTLPPEKNKVVLNKLKSQVAPVKRPLLPEALTLLEKANDIVGTKGLIFTGAKTGEAINPNTTLTMPRAVITRAKKAYGYDMPHWSLHDLRKTARTNFSKFTDVVTAERMLGHEIRGVQSVYDYHDYLDKQRAAYRQWFDHLKGLGM